MALAACFPTPGLHLRDKLVTPSAAPAGASGHAPTVEALVDHIRCEIGEAYYTRAGIDEKTALANQKASDITAVDALGKQKKLWRRLYDDHFKVAASLTVFVSHAEGLAPQASWVWPKDFKGGTLNIISPVTKSTPTATAPATPINPSEPQAPYNLALALNGQVGAIQDNQIVIQYAIDMHDLIDDLSYTPGGGYTGISLCRKADSAHWDGLEDGIDLVETGGGLRGSLDLDETIGGGLSAIDDAYLPLTDGDVSAATAPATLGGTGNTMFSTKIDFILTQSLSGGPSLTTLRFKLAGGSGVSAPAASGGGAGGGPASGLLSSSRTDQDTLILTLSGVCQDKAPGTEILLWVTPRDPRPVRDKAYNIEMDLLALGHDGKVDSGKGRNGNLATVYFPPVVLLPSDSSFHPIAPADNFIVQVPQHKKDGDQYQVYKVFTMKLIGFNAPIPGKNIRNLHVVGELTDVRAQQSAGSIDADYIVDPNAADYDWLRKQNAVITNQATQALGVMDRPRSYWDTLQVCSDSPIERGEQSSRVLEKEQQQIDVLSTTAGNSNR